MSRVTVGNNGITRGYNALTHRGVDIGYSNNEENNQVIAHSAGTVTWTQTGQKHNTKATGNASYGNAVKIKHPDGYYTLYAHLKSVKVKKNQKVKKGQVIGIMGDTGKAYGRHLHFEVRNKKDNRINPTKYIYCDLPGLDDTITYQTWDCKKKKWLPNVKANTNDYAGNKGNPIGAIYVDNLEYRVHQGNRWIPWVKGRNDYAGNKKAINGFEIKGAVARVYTSNGWSEWKTSITTDKDISAIQIKVD